MKMRRGSIHKFVLLPFVLLLSLGIVLSSINAAEVLHNSIIPEERGITSISIIKNAMMARRQNNNGDGGRLRRLFGRRQSHRHYQYDHSIENANGRNLENNDDGQQQQGDNDDNDDDINIDDDNNHNNNKQTSMCIDKFMYFFKKSKSNNDASSSSSSSEEESSNSLDTCDVYQSAYQAANCNNVYSYQKSSSNNNNNDDDTNTSGGGYNYNDDDKDIVDDYFFTQKNHITCCRYLALQIDMDCDQSEIITNMHLLLIATVLLLCEIAKSIIKRYQINWLPDAGGCIIVGALCGFIAQLSSHNLDALSFNEDLFLCILLPPIIFEASLEVNKNEFKRRRLAILMFAIVGTILSTFMTGYIVHYGSYYFASSEEDEEDNAIPLLDSFVFGALISSIDPVAILSVLSSINLTERDTVFIMVFGESLLNDGIAITLFKTLIRHYETNSGSISTDEVLGTTADFVIVGCGSIFIGLICGVAALFYYQLLRKILTPSMEVGSFFLWAGIPYYICDECNLSGIVAIVTMGFFMDIYIANPKDLLGSDGSGASSTFVPKIVMETPMNIKINPLRDNSDNHYVDLGDSVPCNPENCYPVSPSARSMYSLTSLRSLRTFNMRELIMREERFRLTVEADKHVRFVAHLLASICENCIFVYLGLFLYSKKYVWDLPLIGISIVACTTSRAVMVQIVCHLVWYINILRQKFGFYKPTHMYLDQIKPGEPYVSRTATALQDPKIKLVLILSGLRGAVSFALVESVPQYNGVTKVGSMYKGEMKAMTSASIMFTIFLIGGSSYYIINKLDIKRDPEDAEIIELPGGSEPRAQRRRSLRWAETAPKPEEPLRQPYLPNI